MTRYLVTGGLGFIGSNYVRHLLETGECSKVLNLDKQTYAGNPANLEDIASDERYFFVKGDICDPKVVDPIFEEFRPEVVVNFAAESHVDRSIGAPDEFIRTDVFGVFTLLEAARRHPVDLFVQISTDEVYGSIDQGFFTEQSPLIPSSPYAASKAGGDRLAHSYFVTYQVPVIVTRASNNYGPFQYPEKLIPLFVTNALDDQPLPLYGDGLNVRDWLYVRDHCTAVSHIVQHGTPGECFNVAGGNEHTNIEITKRILALLDKPESLIQPVEDRKGHDRRYAVDGSKLAALGWTPAVEFETALAETVAWYRANRSWWEPLKSGEFRRFYEANYKLKQP